MSTETSTTEDAANNASTLPTEEIQNYKDLLAAIRSEDLDGVRAACERCPGVVTFAESDGQQALHVAASVGHRGIVEELIAHGADALAEVGTVRKYDDSSVNALPVDLAAREGHADVVELLNKTIDEQISADPDFRYRALTLAAERGALGEVERIVKMDPALVKRQDAQDWTPFLLAVSNGHTDVVVHLLNEGADLGQWVRDDPKFFTPFDLAADLPYSKIPYILREARARLDGEQED
ncbi:TPA: ankyrin repeat domain-containing protein [Burkholderia lata]